MPSGASARFTGTLPLSLAKPIRRTSWPVSVSITTSCVLGWSSTLQTTKSSVATMRGVGGRGGHGLVGATARDHVDARQAFEIELPLFRRVVAVEQHDLRIGPDEQLCAVVEPREVVRLVDQVHRLTRRLVRADGVDDE